MDLIYTLLSWLSLLKQRLFCNVENIIYMKDDRNIPEIHPKIEIKCKVLDSNNLENYLCRREIKKNQAKFRYLLNRSCKMYLAIYDENIAGYYWVCKLDRYKPYLYNHDPLFAGFNKFYIFHCHTFEKYRRKRIYSYVLTRIFRDTLKENEIILISTDIKNIPSQKGIEKAGFTKLGTLNYMQLGIFKFRQKLMNNI